jgi:hypothetical protein
VRVQGRYGFAHSPGLTPALRRTYRTTDRRVPWLVRAAEGADPGLRGEIDLITLDVKGTMIERLDVAPAPLESEEEEAEDEPVAGPIAIAVDVNDTEETSAATLDSPSS